MSFLCLSKGVDYGRSFCAYQRVGKGPAKGSGIQASIMEIVYE